MRFSNPFLTIRNFAREFEPVNQSSASAVAGRSTAYAAEQAPDSSYSSYPMQDKTILLRPLNDEHLLEVYREAKAMKLSEEFIRLIEDALRTRNIESARYEAQDNI